MTLPPFPVAAEHLFAALGDAVDALAERTNTDLDWQLRDSVLTLDIGHQQWVVNAHAPREEIWLAGHSGAHHFQRDANGVWTDTRSGESFTHALTIALHSAGIHETLALPKECGAM